MCVVAGAPLVARRTPKVVVPRVSYPESSQRSPAPGWEVSRRCAAAAIHGHWRIERQGDHVIWGSSGTVRSVKGFWTFFLLYGPVVAQLIVTEEAGNRRIHGPV